MKKLKILLLGCEGQVGWELQRSLAPLGEVVAFDRNLDLTQPEALAEAVRTIAPHVIVNAAAHTAVDKAERFLEGFLDLVERGGAAAQMLGISTEAEIRVDRFPDQVAEILQIQGRQITGLIP